MNEDRIAPMTPLDQMLAQDSLQMLKAAVPYFPADAQRVFALYAKIPVRSYSRRGFSFTQLTAASFALIFVFYSLFYIFMLSFCRGSCLTEEFFLLFPPVGRMDR